MSKSAMFAITPTLDTEVIDIDSATSNYAWTPAQTYICYGGLIKMVEAGGAQLAKTNQVGFGSSSTAAILFHIPAGATARTERAGALVSGPFKIAAGTTYYFKVYNAETATNTGTCLLRLFVDVVDP